MSEKRNKFLSRRFIAALWAMVMITIIVILDRADFAALTSILAGVVGVWIGAESMTKKLYIDSRDG